VKANIFRHLQVSARNSVRDGRIERRIKGNRDRVQFEGSLSATAGRFKLFPVDDPFWNS